VSTLKQGEKGVSLQEQRASIARYAERQGLQITQWCEECLTAAKKGRPLFTKMLKGLQNGDAQGVIIHKIDRSARNLRDWADLGELIDAGILVHFANESLDLHSRGGRLSADIQAVVAADYVRNLREETRKGIYGRLKQGIYPFNAPLGYLNSGGGKVKTIDPIRGSLVRQAFEIYATGRHTIDSLLAELHQKGLRNRTGHTLSRNGVSKMLNNPFYAGVIRLKTTNERFIGHHEPLVSMALFKLVQARLVRRLRTRAWIHDFRLRGLFQCSLCERFLIGERQKGHIYYRCQTSGCPTRTFREEVLEEAMLKAWAPMAATAEWRERLLAHLAYVQEQDGEGEQDRRVNIEAQIGALKARLTRLIDAFLDGSIDKAAFDERKGTLLEEQRSLEDSLRPETSDPEHVRGKILEWLELVSSAQANYGLGSEASRREMAIRLCSNRSVAGKNVVVEPSFPFHVLEKRAVVTDGGHQRYATRTIKQIARELWEWGKAEVKRQELLDNAA
jgi:DNA invertase Pin-like site-specific DNA recombinase